MNQCPPSLPSPQALLQLPYLDSLYGYSLKLLRYADTTALASMVRADWTFYSSHPALFLSTYLAHGLLVDYFEKKRRCGARGREDATTNLEWLASLWDWYTSYLLHPIASLQQQQPPSDQSDWDDDPGLLFQRLAFPDLWLRPLVDVDYIKALPTWRFGAAGGRCCGGGRPDEDTESHSDSEGGEQTADGPRDCACGQDGGLPLCCRRGNGCPSSSEDGGGGRWPCGVLRCSECVVCLENFAEAELLMALPCGHAFHQQCIVVWLAAGRHCCPVCRWPSYKKRLHRAQSASPDPSPQDPPQD